MKTMSLALIACATLAVQDPATTLKKSVETVRSQKSMKATFNATIDVPNSDPLKVHGTALVAGDVLFIEYHASGGNVKLIVRKGETALEYNWLLEQWVDSKEMGDAHVGRGLSNPNEVLDVLLANAESAKDRSESGRKVLAINLDGGKIQPLLKFFIDEKDVRWADSQSEAVVDLASDTLLPSKIVSRAVIGWKKDEKIKYQGEVTIESYGKETELKFQEKDRQGKTVRDIPLTEQDRKKLGLP